jgi:hypothetical protein
VRNPISHTGGGAARRLSRPGALARFGFAAPPAIASARWDDPAL